MKIFVSLVFILLLSLASIAQSGPPALCKPCLFYGGDLNPNDPNASGSPNENTEDVPNTSTYTAITVPKGRAILVEGILFQTLFEQINKMDPNGVSWEIRTGDIFGNGGTLVASGQGAVAMQPTGRSLSCCLEYTLAVKLNPAVQLTGGSPRGTTYWFNMTPQCTNTKDTACAFASYFVSNTTEQTNGFHPMLQPSNQAVINSAYYHYQWEQVCSTGVPGCSYFSFGLIGKVLQ